MKRTSILVIVGTLAVLLLVLAPMMVRAATSATASAAPEALAAAQQLYDRGDYAVAAASYRQLADQGIADSRLFYNMGLAYLRAGDLGQALWSLRSADALNPRDADTDVALAQVKAALVEQTPELAATAVPGNLPARLASVTASWVTTDELAWIALALWGALIALLLISIWVNDDAARKLMRGMAAVTAVGLVIVAVSWGVRLTAHSGQPAVVIATAELRTGPGASYVARTALPTGLEVLATATRGDWTQVTLPNGAEGWMPGAAVAGIGS